MKIDTTKLENKIAERIRNQPLKVPIEVSVGVCAAGMALGLIPAVWILGAAFAVLLLLVLVCSVVLLAISRRDLLARMRTKDSVLEWYAAMLVERQVAEPAMYSFLKWDEDVHVAKNGHCTATRVYEIQVGSAPLDCFWNVAISNNRTTMSQESQDRVIVRAHLLDDDGSGVELDVTKRWEGNRLRTFVHFGVNHEPQTIIKVEITWEWPGLLNDMLAGHREDRYWSMLHSTEQFSSKLTLAKELVQLPVVSPKTTKDIKPDVITNSNGSVTFSLEKSNLAAGDKFGYQLQLKRV